MPLALTVGRTLRGANFAACGRAGARSRPDGRRAPTWRSRRRAPPPRRGRASAASTTVATHTRPDPGRRRRPACVASMPRRPNTRSGELRRRQRMAAVACRSSARKDPSRGARTRAPGMWPCSYCSIAEALGPHQVVAHVDDHERRIAEWRARSSAPISVADVGCRLCPARRPSRVRAEHGGWRVASSGAQRSTRRDSISRR